MVSKDTVALVHAGGSRAAASLDVGPGCDVNALTRVMSYVGVGMMGAETRILPIPRE